MHQLHLLNRILIKHSLHFPTPTIQRTGAPHEPRAQTFQLVERVEDGSEVALDGSGVERGKRRGASGVARGGLGLVLS